MQLRAVRGAILGEDGIREKQRGVVKAMLDSCPTDGWATGDAVGEYAAQALEDHMAEALLDDILQDTEVQTWLAQTSAIAASAANAVGHENLKALSTGKAAAGELVLAARVAWATRLVRNISAHVRVDLMFRAAELLESANDPSSAKFETEVLEKAVWVDVITERNIKAQRRYEALLEVAGGGGTPFEAKWKESMDAWIEGFMAWAFFMKPGGAPLADVRTGNFQMRDSIRTHSVAASKLTDEPCLANSVVLQYYVNLSFTLGTCGMDDWDPHACGGEDACVAALDYYAKHPVASRKTVKSSCVQLDYFCYGMYCLPLALCLGNFTAIDRWAASLVSVYKEFDFSAAGFAAEADHGNELWWMREACVVLVRLNRRAAARATFEAAGFAWSDAGFAQHELSFASCSAKLPGMTKDEDAISCRLGIYLASPQTAALDAAVSAWIPAPSVLVQIGRESCWAYAYGGIFSVLHKAARAFLQLGRDDAAAEVARAAVSCAEPAVQIYSVVECHCVLGEVAAKRGELAKASGHFSAGLGAAKASGKLPMLELLVARDWARAVGDCGAIDAGAVIDGACAAMGKSREQLAAVLG